MAQDQPLLKLEGVSKTYPSGTEGSRLPVLSEIELEVAPGESLAILGPSGCGKSTLLNVMGTLDQPDAGRVWLDGRDVSGLSEDELAAVRRRRIGFIFQAHHLLPHCSVWENVLVPTLAGGGADGPGREETLARAERLLKRVGLADRLGHRPGQLSGGERQRVAVARSLILGPALLLADEPTGALDRASAEALGALLMELNREENVALVVVTHSWSLARLMQRHYELRDGRLGTFRMAAA